MICFILSSLSILGSIEGKPTVDFLPKTTLTQDIIQTAYAQASAIIKRQPKWPENNNRSILNQRSGLAIQSQRSMGFGPYKLFKMLGCAFLIQGIQAHKTMYHPCPAPLKIYEPQHPEAANFFNRCINRVCQRYTCPSDLPPGMIPISEESCPQKLCITNKRGLLGSTITAKEQRIINRLARREERCWRRTCEKYGSFFSPALIIPNNIIATQQLNQCFEPVCKILSTNKCGNDPRLWRVEKLDTRKPHVNIVQRLYSLFKSFCNDTLCPGRYIEKYSFSMREPAITVVNKLLQYCKNAMSHAYRHKTKTLTRSNQSQ